MTEKIPTSLQPNLGLSQIEDWDGEETSLPDDSRLTPIDAQVEAKLQSILVAKNFDSLILNALKPEVEDKRILLPGFYYALRDQVLEKMEKALPHLHASVEQAELNEAITLLQNQIVFHDHKEENRYALLKG